MRVIAALRRYRQAQVVVFCAAALFTSGQGCAGDCTQSTSPPLRSPNGEWTAQIKRSICGGKLLALGSDSTVVQLSRKKRDYQDLSAVVLSAEGLKGEDIQVRWVSDHELHLTIPSHTDIQTLLAAFYDIDVSLGFVPPDPEERARWVSYRRAMAAWTDQLREWDRRRATDPAGAGPPPKEPRWQMDSSSEQK